MARKAPRRATLDPKQLEARTQAIGHELFAAATREHAHLSVLNRWTAQVLSWCLKDPAVKRAMLGFIDVLPSLRTPRDIARHVREYFPTQDLHLPAALRIGTEFGRSGLLTHHALAAIVRQLVEQVARQFIAQSDAHGAARVIQTVASRGATCSLDVLGEQVVSESEADASLATCRTLLDEMTTAYAQRDREPRLVSCGPLVNLSVKPSALTPRFDPISPGRSVERAAQRLLPLVASATQRSALVNLDMEQYALRDLTLELAKSLLVDTETSPTAVLGIVIQAYLRDSEQVVKELLTWLAAHARTVTIRLVKGAYWDTEVAHASQANWPVPVYQQKGDTDGAFERLTQRLLSAHPLVTTAIASHNVRSIAHAMAIAELFTLSKDALEFQFLYGMGDALQAAVIERGYPVRLYTPIGELIPGMAYLVRRILENTANESFLRQDWFQERSAEALLSPPVVVAQSKGSDHGRTETPLADFARAIEQERFHHALQIVQADPPRIYPLWIGDGPVQTASAWTVHNPAHPEDILGSVAQAGPHEVERAVSLAEHAQSGWARTPVRERVASLHRVAEVMGRHRDELAAWGIPEVGKPWREADADVVEAIDYLDYYGRQMLELAEGKPLPQWPGERNVYRYNARGIAIVIAPWNFPAAILTGMTAAALVAGNTVIMKPAEQSSIIASRIAQIFRDADLPSGVLQYLPGVGEEVGAALARHPATHTILFTGSKAVGLSIIEAAARVVPGQGFIKHVIAEMGGKNAIVIDDDADLDAAVHGVLHSAFGYAGQKCSAASRVIVHEAVYDRLMARLVAATDRVVVGDPADPGTDVGPLIDLQAQRRLEEAIAHAETVGTIAYRYPSSRLPSQGYFVGPTIVTDVPVTDRLAREELFGPFVCVFRVSNFVEGLQLANDTDYALTGGVYSRSPSHLEEAIRTFDVGNLYLNRPITGARVGRQPFGGRRLSGLGTKAGGPDYLLQLLVPKTICANTARHGIPLE